MSFVYDGEVKLWYEITGSSGPVIVQTGGFGLLHDQFTPVTPLLAKEHRVLNWNYRGAGQSDRSLHQGIGLDRWVDDLEFILDQLDLRQVHLWGTSTGAHISVRYAARYPQRVRTLLTYPTVKTNQASRAGMAAFLTVTETFGYEALAKVTQWLGSGKDHVFDEKGNALAKHEAESFRRNFDIDDIAHTLDVFSSCNLLADVEKLTIPVLLLVGGSGHMGAKARGVAKDIETFQKLCPQTEIEIIERGGGTYCMLEYPEETANAVGAWIARHGD